MQSFIETVKVIGQELLIIEESYSLILQYVNIRNILVECLLCWTLRKILPIGFLLDGQYLIETLFSQLNLKPSERYLLKTMTDIFLKTGHGMIDMAIYFTDFNIQLATNLDYIILDYIILDYILLYFQITKILSLAKL